MNYQEVFSWAEDKSGKMVYVDDVPRGVACNCVCPYCRENLIARHGTERTHGFAHASKERGANLKICLKVIVFKLAEQIIKTEKRIYMPSYYGIFKPKSVEFETVEINGDFEREDRQPDIIATTKDNQKYLIEFCFKDYVRYKQEIDFENLNCLEIDLAGQKIDNRDSLKNFLLNCDGNRRWLNNDTYFNSIKREYENVGKSIWIVSNEECAKCLLKHECCAVKNKDSHWSFLTIFQNEKEFHLCRAEEYTEKMQAYYKQQEENLRRYHDIFHNCRRINEKNAILSLRKSEVKQVLLPDHMQSSININPVERTCFDCEKNLQWANKDGWANISVTFANTCRRISHMSYNCFVERQMRVGIWRVLLLLPFQVFISDAAIQALLLVAIFFL